MIFNSINYFKSVFSIKCSKLIIDFIDLIVDYLGYIKKAFEVVTKSVKVY